MAKKGDLYLGALGSEILLPAFGRTFKIDDVELSRKERLASGRLVKEIISVKKKFTLNYSLIDGDDLTEILDIYDLNSELSFLIYTSDTVHNDYIVFMSPIDRTRVLLQDNGLWSDVSIELDEV